MMILQSGTPDSCKIELAFKTPAPSWSCAGSPHLKSARMSLVVDALHLPNRELRVTLRG
jgi:hypothetical protein